MTEIKRTEKGEVLSKTDRCYGGMCAYILRGDMKAFLSFCEGNGHKTRNHSDPFKDGYQVRHDGHWMALVWNNGLQRYSADRRLSLIVQSFAAHSATVGT